MAEIADELRKACSGHPHAKIAWPHRLLHRAADELDAKDKRIAELEAGGWQPIETAPKDGTPVDLWCCAPGLSTGPARVTDCWFSGANWWRYDEQYGDDQCRSSVHNATHWQPLPAPPFHLPNKEDRNG